MWPRWWCDVRLQRLLFRVVPSALSCAFFIRRLELREVSDTMLYTGKTAHGSCFFCAHFFKSCVAVFLCLRELPSLPVVCPPPPPPTSPAETACVALYILDYVFKWLQAEHRTVYVLRPLPLLDLCVITSHAVLLFWSCDWEASGTPGGFIPGTTCATKPTVRVVATRHQQLPKCYHTHLHTELVPLGHAFNNQSQSLSCVRACVCV